MIPVGLDAYRMWDRWPYQRIGVRAYMRSTYDRTGGNEGADASHFLYQLADDNNVSLDVEGPGVLYFVRTNHWHGSPWRYTVDGKEHIVLETSTADPSHPVEDSTFIPKELFPPPLAYTWSTTKGADLNWAPMPFEKSLRMGYSRTHYGTGYYVYHQFVPGTKLSRPIKAWDGTKRPDNRIIALLSRSGSDIAPKYDGVTTKCGSGSAVPSPDGWRLPIQQITEAPSTLRALEFSAPREHALSLGRSRLRIWWDGRKEPSIDAPLALFFGAGTLYNRDNREYLVKAFPVNIRFDKEKVRLSCYFPMPFFKSARFELTGNGTPIPDLQYNYRYQRYKGPINHAGYFHATYRDIPTPERGKDMVLLDTRGIEGSQDWSGSFVGMSWIFSHDANLGTLEGDPRFFFDDSQSPQAQGTGTEEWGGGGDYWGGRNMTLPFAGHPCGARDAKSAKNEEDKIESAYRFLLADLMPFGKNARIQLEHGGTNESTEHYESVVYWYGLPSPSLVKTDTLKIGDRASESAHRYFSPSASASYEIDSRYEWGVDHLGPVEIYPLHKDIGRTTTGASKFSLKLEPNNWGVMLRRKLDYQYPNQRADVYVADIESSSPSYSDSSAKAVARQPSTSTSTSTSTKWRKAGIWYSAGSNTCVFSNPREELGATQHIAQTSNRRFRDDEFLIGRNLTRGRKAIRVKIVFTPVKRPLFSGHPIPPLAWSEIRYDAYCFVMPKAPDLKGSP